MKKTLALLLMLLLCIPTLWACGLNDETYYEYEENDDGTLTIISISETYSKTLKIPGSIGGKTVTAIGKFAFYNNDYIRKIVLPDSVTTVGECAFADCNKLNEVIFGKGCTEIGLQAFEGCDALENIDLSKTNLKIVADLAFNKCLLLESFDPPQTLEKIGIGAFDNCEQLIIVTDKSAVAKEYAEANGFPTEFSDSDNYLFLKMALIIIACLALLFTLSFLWKKRKNKA